MVDAWSNSTFDQVYYVTLPSPLVCLSLLRMGWGQFLGLVKTVKLTLLNRREQSMGQSYLEDCGCDWRVFFVWGRGWRDWWSCAWDTVLLWGFARWIIACSRPITPLVTSRSHQISRASYPPPWRQGPVNPEWPHQISCTSYTSQWRAACCSGTCEEYYMGSFLSSTWIHEPVSFISTSCCCLEMNPYATLASAGAARWLHQDPVNFEWQHQISCASYTPPWRSACCSGTCEE